MLESKLKKVKNLVFIEALFYGNIKSYLESLPYSCIDAVNYRLQVLAAVCLLVFSIIQCIYCHCNISDSICFKFCRLLCQVLAVSDCSCDFFVHFIFLVAIILHFILL